MAKRVVKKKEESKFRCRDCRHSYDWHSKAIDGHLILCRCKFDNKTEFGRWSKFLKDPQCEHFLLRQEA